MDRPETERGCLLFDLHGFRGVAVRNNSYVQAEDAIWELGEIDFAIPKGDTSKGSQFPSSLLDD
ncbi:MAG: hypothetical protein EOP04_26195 [Proteobacteria bacterium]|nr:MAG: hypothetical protein EOP04_26195 [Pseudomonadota bacterium]